MLPHPFAPFPDRVNQDQNVQSAVAGCSTRRKPEGKIPTAFTPNCENECQSTNSTSSSNAVVSSNAKQRQLLPQRIREVPKEGNNRPMTPTNLVSMSAPSLPSNWYELAIKARTNALRESQQRTAALVSLPSEPAAQDPSAPASNLEDGATQQNGAPEASTASEPMPLPKKEPLVNSLAPTKTLPITTAEASQPSQPLAGGLVSVSSTNDPETSTQDAITATSTTQQPIIATLSNTSISRGPQLEVDALRTEVMGPPPSLPVDPCYPPLDPMVTDVPAPAPNPKRRGAASAVNGTQRKPVPAQAPADFVPPTNMNGKMPFALFQTVKKGTSAESNKNPALAAQAERTQRYVQILTTTCGCFIWHTHGFPRTFDVRNRKKWACWVSATVASGIMQRLHNLAGQKRIEWADPFSGSKFAVIRCNSS